MSSEIYVKSYTCCMNFKLKWTDVVFMTANVFFGIILFMQGYVSYVGSCQLYRFMSAMYYRFWSVMQIYVCYADSCQLSRFTPTMRVYVNYSMKVYVRNVYLSFMQAYVNYIRSCQLCTIGSDQSCRFMSICRFMLVMRIHVSYGALCQLCRFMSSRL